METCLDHSCLRSAVSVFFLLCSSRIDFSKSCSARRRACCSSDSLCSLSRFDDISRCAICSSSTDFICTHKHTHTISQVDICVRDPTSTLSIDINTDTLIEPGPVSDLFSFSSARLFRLGRRGRHKRAGPFPCSKVPFSLPSCVLHSRVQLAGLQEQLCVFVVIQPALQASSALPLPPAVPVQGLHSAIPVPSLIKFTLN